MRKPILLIIGSLATSVSALVMGSEITIVSLGVLNQPALAKAYYAPFRDATATKIAAFTYDDLSFVRDMVAAWKPTWDVVEVAVFRRRLRLRDRLGLGSSLRSSLGAVL